MNRVIIALAAFALLVVACGGTGTDGATTSAAPTTTASTTSSSTTISAPATVASTTTLAPTSTTTGEPAPSVEELESYRFVITVGLVDQPGSPEVRPLYEVAGEATTDPEAMRIFGELQGQSVDLITDGTEWWDLDDPALDLTAADVEFYLGANVLLLPDWIVVLLIEEEAWLSAGGEIIRGIPTERAQRLDVTKGRDWQLGDLALLEVWRDELGQLVKFTAWLAVGDNTGFPVTTWEITERNPELEIMIPG